MGGALLSLSLLSAHHLRSVSFEFWTAAVCSFAYDLYLSLYLGSMLVNLCTYSYTSRVEAALIVRESHGELNVQVVVHRRVYQLRGQEWPEELAGGLAVRFSLLASISRQKRGSYGVRIICRVAGENVGDHRQVIKPTKRMYDW